jgi:hypothetical protein
VNLDWARTERLSLRLLSAAGQEMGEGRSPGDHLSDILKYMRKVAGLKVGDFDDDGMSPADKARLMGGFVLEICLEHAFKRYLTLQLKGIQAEIQADNIYMTRDWVEETADGDIVWEGKSTERTRRKFDEGLERLQKELDSGLPFEDTSLFGEFWGWFMQLMAYCLHSGTLKGNLVVWWKRGNYTWDNAGRADVRVYPFTFTLEELQRNWERILAFNAARKAAQQEAE